MSPGGGTSLGAWQGSASALRPRAVSSWHSTGTCAKAYPTWRTLRHLCQRLLWGLLVNHNLWSPLVPGEF